MLGSFVAMLAVILIPLPIISQSTPDEASRRPYVDWMGGAAITTSMMLLLVTLSGVDSWSDIRNFIQLTLSSVLFGGFVLWQWRLEKDESRRPRIRLSLFKRAELSAALLTYGFFFASYPSFMVFASLFFQEYLRLSVLETTVRSLPSGIACFFVTWVVAPTLSCISDFHLLIFASLLYIASPLLFALPIPSSASYWAYGFPSMLATLGIEFHTPVLALFVVQCLPEADQALGRGLVQTANNLGKTIGLAIATLIQAVVAGDDGGSPGNPDLLRGLRAGQWASVGMAATAFGISVVFLRGLKRL